ncbi:MAG: hypothetical protein V4509_01135 [Patescibacteria group bacterium]
MESEALSIKSTIDENEELLRQSISDTTLDKKREVTTNKYYEFLPVFEIENHIRELRTKLDEIPKDKEYDFERAKVEAQLESFKEKLNQIIINVRADMDNPRFVEYTTEMKRIERSQTNTLPPNREDVELN